jgi:hypothetical protein
MVLTGVLVPTRRLVCRVQFTAVLELLMEWEDRTALETMMNATARIQDGTGSKCAKPCIGGDVQGLCCDGVFSLQIDYGNAVEPPTVSQNLYVGENKVRQGVQIYGTFYQDFKLKNYPFASLEADISLRFNQMTYNNSEYVTVLPIPVASSVVKTNLGASAGNGWYVTWVTLAGNRPAYVRQVDGWDMINPVENPSAMDFRGARLDDDDVYRGQERLSSFTFLLDATTPALDFRFGLGVGTVDAFITTLPLALLALLNLAVFLVPLFEARSRIQFSISLFFTTTATLLTQNFGGTNQLNAIQRLAVVIFSMLVFTVFSTIIWNGLFNYKEGKAEMKNDWAFVTGRWKTSKVVMPAVTQKDMQLRQSTKRYPDAVDDSDQSNDDCSPVEAHDVTTEDAHGKEMGGKAADCAAMFSPEMRRVLGNGSAMTGSFGGRGVVFATGCAFSRVLSCTW